MSQIILVNKEIYIPSFNEELDEYYDGKYDKKYGYQHGLCLEPQLFPDSINCNNFINPLLKKGKKYHSKIVMKLKNDF